jgi:uncharacterized protein (TIGR03437 family)
MTIVIGAVLMSTAAVGGTFGRVVAIGGEASDLALDESRGVLYIANFTANRIDVMSLATNNVQTSINVAANPSSISLSPDKRWLLVAHYGNNAAPATQNNALTLIDLTASNSKQTFALGNPPLGVAFGADDKALVVTSSEFILFDPALGTTQVLQTVAQVVTNSIPQPPASFPTNIVQASITTSADGMTIAGVGGGDSSFLVFRFTVANHTIRSTPYGSSPKGGPRAVSLADDGSQMTFAWWTMDANFNSIGEFNGNPGGPYQRAAGLLNVGSHAIDSSRGLIYAQIPLTGATSTTLGTPILQVLDADNLTLRDTLHLPENLAGKSVLTSDHNTMYGVSDSGVLVLPVGKMSSVPRLSASVEDLVFRGNFCNRNTARQTLTITDPGGGNTPFKIASSTPGLSVSPTSGVTPAVITVIVDPNAFSTQKGTVTAALTLSSTVAVNFPAAVRVLINSQDVSQRGAFVDLPGRIVDVLADPKRNVYYVLNQDKNLVQIFNATTNTQSGSLRTCTVPTSMAITFDQQYLLVGCDHAFVMPVFDLDTLQATAPIVLPSDYVQSVATSANAILVHVRRGSGNDPGIDRVDMASRVATPLPTLGVYQNKLALDTALVSSSNGAHILMASADGSVMIYDANADSFTVSRKDFTSLVGSYAASSFNQYVVGNHLLDASGVSQLDLPTSNGNASGFAFVDQGGYYTTAPSSAAPGVIQQINLSTGVGIQPTAMVEAPILSPTITPPANTTNSTSCSTTTNGNTTVQTCTVIVGTNITTSTLTCTATTTGNTTTNNCTSTSGSTSSAPAPPVPPPPPSAFTRTLAPLPSRNALVSLTTSGFTVLPWTYAASVAPPQVAKIVSAADGTSPAAPGGLISIYGNQLSATNLATSEIPLPTALANSCLTVNGQPMPLIFVSPNQINAQMPAQALGDVTVQVHTPGGISDNYNMIVQPTAPAVFLAGVAGPNTNLPTVIRAQNNLLVTDSNPIHRNDTLIIYLTGCGNTNPPIPDGLPAPSDPLARTVVAPTVGLGNTSLPVIYGGMTPGQVGLCQFNVSVPSSTPTGLGMPLTIVQGGMAQTLKLRVVD